MLGGIDATQVLTRLSDDDLVVLDEATHEPIGAYPMTMEETDHLLKVNGYQIHAMCALDALGVSPMFGYNVEINSCCDVSGEAIELKQNRLEIVEVKPITLPGIFQGKIR
ncbi:MAG TPA: hypothetical protein DDW50_14260 [Firmicutes bacterium]|jgi:alkylmercury lyase|nr:hypothetical protein [Bacillota bacterium]